MPSDRQPELAELEQQPPLGRLGGGERLQPLRVASAGRVRVQHAARAQLAGARRRASCTPAIASLAQRGRRPPPPARAPATRSPARCRSAGTPSSRRTRAGRRWGRRRRASGRREGRTAIAAVHALSRHTTVATVGADASTSDRVSICPPEADTDDTRADVRVAALAGRVGRGVARRAARVWAGSTRRSAGVSPTAACTPFTAAFTPWATRNLTFQGRVPRGGEGVRRRRGAELLRRGRAPRAPAVGRPPARR